MKKFIITTLAIVTFGLSSKAGWFSTPPPPPQDHTREIHLEQQIQHEQQHIEDLGGIIIVLGIGCVVTLVVGAILGSAALRKSNEHQ